MTEGHQSAFSADRKLDGIHRVESGCPPEARGDDRSAVFGLRHHRPALLKGFGDVQELKEGHPISEEAVGWGLDLINLALLPAIDRSCNGTLLVIGVVCGDSRVRHGLVLFRGCV